MVRLTDIRSFSSATSVRAALRRLSKFATLVIHSRSQSIQVSQRSRTTLPVLQRSRHIGSPNIRSHGSAASARAVSRFSRLVTQDRPAATRFGLTCIQESAHIVSRRHTRPHSLRSHNSAVYFFRSSTKALTLQLLDLQSFAPFCLHVFFSRTVRFGRSSHFNRRRGLHSLRRRGYTSVLRATTS